MVVMISVRERVCTVIAILFVARGEIPPSVCTMPHCQAQLDLSAESFICPQVICFMWLKIKLGTSTTSLMLG